MKMMKNKMKYTALLVCISWMLSVGAMATTENTLTDEKGEPTHEYIEGVEIAPGVFEYRSEDGVTVVTSESWEPALKPAPISVAPWRGDMGFRFPFGERMVHWSILWYMMRAFMSLLPPLNSGWGPK